MQGQLIQDVDTQSSKPYGYNAQIVHHKPYDLLFNTSRLARPHSSCHSCTIQLKNRPQNRHVDVDQLREDSACHPCTIQLKDGPQNMHVDVDWLREDRRHVNFVINHAWSDDTLNRYEASVKEFFAFCQSRGIHPLSSSAVSEDLLCSFAASMAGLRAGGTASAKIAGLRAWHIQNALPWMGSLRLKYTLKSTKNLQPPESKKDTWPPVSCEMLQAIWSKLDLTALKDTCIWAIATTLFWAQICMGEICPRTEKNFDVTRTTTWDHFGLPNVTGTQSLHLPHTKWGGTKGETVMVTCQRNEYDPIMALTNHARVDRCCKSDTVSAIWNAAGAHLVLNAQEIECHFFRLQITSYHGPLFPNWQNNQPSLAGCSARCGQAFG